MVYEDIRVGNELPPKFYAGDRHGTQLLVDNAFNGLVKQSILEKYPFFNRCEIRPCLNGSLPLFWFQQLWYVMPETGEKYDVHGHSDAKHACNNDDRQFHVARAECKMLGGAFVAKAVGLERGLLFRAYQ